MKGIIAYIIMFLIVGAVCFGAAQLGKKISYHMWYKSQVESSVMDILEREGLIVPEQAEEE